ncbi:MAG TPA: NAD(P)-binding domain-containing protein, partial [Acidimicrobiales bacterium]|nr:NAD(P)-binding domain-containing protein [Acidimicrobiales bacterium]
VAIHSTISPDLAPLLAARAAAVAMAVIDAPVSGGVAGARAGDLVVMVGATPETFEVSRPAFERFGSLVMRVGEVGSGTRAKLARNLLQYVGFVAAHEAQRLAEAAGVELAQLAAAVRHSDRVTGGPSAVMVRPTAAPMAADDPLVPIFAHVRDLADKDLHLALDLARSLGVDLPVSARAAAAMAASLGLPKT